MNRLTRLLSVRLLTALSASRFGFQVRVLPVALVLVTLTLGTLVTKSMADASNRTVPIMFVDLEKAELATPFKKLKDDQKEAFYRAYPRDKEMLSRMTLGMQNEKMEECIAGEAPTIAEAVKKFPAHYPMMGRMKQVSGVLEWLDKKKLVFRTESQRYHVDEYFLLYRLQQLGFTSKSEPTQATLDACWMVNRIDGLRLIYMQGIDLH